MSRNSSRRRFLHKAGAVSASLVAGSLSTAAARDVQTPPPLLKTPEVNPDELATDEAYWSLVQQQYTANGPIINLNNGGVSPQPISVQLALNRLNEEASKAPSYYMWRIMDKGREPLRKQLANLAGCDPECLAINRNATEALNTIAYGITLKPGDEVIGTLQDYPNMVQAWRQRQLRDGIVYTQLSFDFPITSPQQIVDAFAAAITPRTRLLHITHIINWVGQIMPVKALCALARQRGIETLVDGAHSFGLLDFTIPELDCDYFGTSLHKFLSAPIGSGLLYIRREKIADIWPLLCNDKPKGTDIRKFETLGTRSFCIEQGIAAAIDFHQTIGSAAKEARIRYLKNYWAEKAMKIPGVKLHTSLEPAYSCAIAGFSIQGMKPETIDQRLISDFGIHVVAIHWENIHCVRVTPHVYTRLSDLDKLVAAIKTIAASA